MEWIERELNEVKNMPDQLSPSLKIKVVLYGSPEAIAAAGGSTLFIEINGDTFGNLVEEIERRYGTIITHCQNLRVFHNSEPLKMSDLLRPLKDGDIIAFYYPLIIAGG